MIWDASLIFHTTKSAPRSLAAVTFALSELTHVQKQ